VSRERVDLPSENVIHAESQFELGAGLGGFEAEAAEELRDARVVSPWAGARHRFLANRAATVALVILSIMCFMAVFARFMHTADPIAPNFNAVNQGPSGSHWFGADPLGRDTYTRLVYGLRVPILTAALGTTVTVVIGTLLGLIAGFSGGRTDFALSRITDFVFAFPGFLLALIVVSFFGPALDNYFAGGGRVLLLAMVFALVSWPTLMRFVRSLTLSLKEQQFIEAARVCGGTNRTIVIRHLLPNIWGLVLVQASFIAIGLVSIEAVLSILGLGVQAPNPDLGSILNEGVQHMVADPWEVFFSSLVLTLLVVGFTFVGDGLRDAIDPRE
jgi:ABC-type dipeptide/oligopeptide/nickel transport system permease subunit